jgi:molybdopterin synthase sulfur carrier subunit
LARLVFLGRLADLAGAGELAVLPGPVAEILARLPESLAIGLSDDRVRWALNGQLVSRESVPSLAEDDELAFLPPVSGG